MNITICNCWWLSNEKDKTSQSLKSSTQALNPFIFILTSFEIYHGTIQPKYTYLSPKNYSKTYSLWWCFVLLHYFCFRYSSAPRFLFIMMTKHWIFFKFHFSFYVVTFLVAISYLFRSIRLINTWMHP